MQKTPYSSQLTLLRFCQGISLLLAIVSFYGLVFGLYYTVKERHLLYLPGMVGYILLIAVGLLAAFGAAFVIGAAGGNIQ